jgi:hypothetical protein
VEQPIDGKNVMESLTFLLRLLQLMHVIVEHLFTELFAKAFSLQHPKESRPDTLWKKQLEPKYWCFSGKPVRYEEAYNYTEQAPYIRILLNPPLATKNVR